METVRDNPGVDTLRRLPLVALVICGLLGLVPGVATAAPLTCPLTLMHNTTLHADLPCTTVTSGVAVTFGKPGLTLDLNGFTIVGHVGSDTAKGVYTTFDNDTITGGTIMNFRNEITSYGANHTVIRGVHMVADGADSSPYGVYLEYGGGDVLSHDSATGFYEGFTTYGSGGDLFANNTLTQNYYGVYTEYETQDRWVGNHLSMNHYGLYDDYGDRTVYRGNTANSNTSDGFYLDCDTYGTLHLLFNTANHNGSSGFYVGDCYYDYGSTAAYSIIKGNTADQNGSYGIEAYDPLQYVVLGNTTNGNQSDTGLYFSDNYNPYNVRMVANNFANHNNGWGIYADYFIPPSLTSNNSTHANSTQNCYNIICP